MIFDNIKYIKEWINKNIYKADCINHNSLSKEVININTYESCIDYKFILPINSELLNISKPYFEEYYIYYLYEDFNTSYAINFLVLPYFDNRIMYKKNFLHFNKVKINKFNNHNINIVNNINF